MRRLLIQIGRGTFYLSDLTTPDKHGTVNHWHCSFEDNDGRAKHGYGRSPLSAIWRAMHATTTA